MRGLLLTAAAVLWTVLLVRLVGLRAFSKMTSFDFVTTVATGSLIAQAGTRDRWIAFLQCLAAIAGVFLVQYALARARQRSESLKSLLTNQPVLLMQDGKFNDDAMVASRVSRSNVLEKLRAANVSDFAQIRAVVLEGDLFELARVLLTRIRCLEQTVCFRPLKDAHEHSTECLLWIEGRHSTAAWNRLLA